MDLLQPASVDRQTDNTLSNEEVLVVLPTENGEQIALPMSALPRDFVPGDNGQIIVVESSIDEQHQEVVVDSSGALNVAQTVEIGNDYSDSYNARRESMDVELNVLDSSRYEKPRQKQKRKEPIVLRPLSKEDEKMELQVIEEAPSSVQEIAIKRKPRKEYRTKKRLRLAAMQEEERLRHNTSVDKTSNVEESSTHTEHSLETQVRHSQTNTPQPVPHQESTKQIKQEEHNQEQPKIPQEQQPPKQQALTERRTRLSNACRVATGKNYVCQVCDYSTDRINNIITHIKESCPKMKKT